MIKREKQIDRDILRKIIEDSKINYKEILDLKNGLGTTVIEGTDELKTFMGTTFDDYPDSLVDEAKRIIRDKNA